MENPQKSNSPQEDDNLDISQDTRSACQKTYAVNLNVDVWIVLAAVLFGLAVIIFGLSFAFLSVSKFQQNSAVSQYQTGYEEGFRSGVDAGMKEAILILDSQKPPANSSIFFPPAIPQ